MSKRFGSTSLVPSGFTLDRVETVGAGMEMFVRPVGRTSACPDCGELTSRIHSRYRRSLGDLPLAGRPVRLILMVRRFRCSRTT
jgi:transposase